MYDCVVTINKANDDAFELLKPLSENDRKELHDDLKKVTLLIADKFDILSEEGGTVAVNARTTSNRYFDIVFTWQVEESEIVVKYDRLKEADLDGYLDAINRNKSSSGEKISAEDV